MQAGSWELAVGTRKARVACLKTISAGLSFSQSERQTAATPALRAPSPNVLSPYRHELLQVFRNHHGGPYHGGPLPRPQIVPARAIACRRLFGSRAASFPHTSVPALARSRDRGGPPARRVDGRALLRMGVSEPRRLARVCARASQPRCRRYGAGRYCRCGGGGDRWPRKARLHSARLRSARYGPHQPVRTARGAASTGGSPGPWSRTGGRGHGHGPAALAGCGGRHRHCGPVSSGAPRPLAWLVFPGLAVPRAAGGTQRRALH